MDACGVDKELLFKQGERLMAVLKELPEISRAVFDGGGEERFMVANNLRLAEVQVSRAVARIDRDLRR